MSSPSIVSTVFERGQAMNTQSLYAVVRMCDAWTIVEMMQTGSADA